MAEFLNSSWAYENDTNHYDSFMELVSTDYVNPNEEPIELTQQEVVDQSPEQVKEFMRNETVRPPDYVQSFMDFAMTHEAAKKNCVPSGSKAAFNKELQSIDLKFTNKVELRGSRQMKEVKKSNSIQMQLFKADEAIESSPFDWTLVQID